MLAQGLANSGIRWFSGVFADKNYVPISLSACNLRMAEQVFIISDAQQV
jgi:hypothetical protein